MADLPPDQGISLPPSSRYLGRRIVVTWADGRVTTGPLAGVTEGTLSQMLDGGAQTVIPYASITSVVLAALPSGNTSTTDVTRERGNRG